MSAELKIMDRSKADWQTELMNLRRIVEFHALVKSKAEKAGQEAIRKEAEKSCETLCACYVLLEFIVENYDWNSAEPALQ